jgi:PAS domain S-box-containing protein
LKPDTLDLKTSTTRDEIAALTERAADLPKEHRAAFLKAVSDLSTTIEELHTAGEELNQQAEELALTRQAVEVERQRYHELFYFAPDGYLVTDTMGIIGEANRAAGVLLGIDPPSLTGKSLIVYVEAKDHRIFTKALARLLKSGPVEDLELHLKCRKGPGFPAAVSVAAIRGPEGKPAGLRWLVRDNTPVKKREQLAALATFPELNPQPITEIDTDGHLQYVNPAAERLLPGLSKEGVSHPWLAGLEMAAASSGISRGEPYSREVEIGERWFEQFASPVMEGRRLRIYGRDITERKRMEDELRKSHEELEIRVEERTSELWRQAELLDLANDAILVRTPDGIINFWNKGAESLYGWAKSEALGKNNAELLHPEFPVPLEEINAEILSEGRWEGEITHFGKNGRPILIFSRQVLRRDGAGGQPEILEINQDFTERRRAEERVRQGQKLEALGTLAGGIAHDINNILVPIMINSELAMLDAPPTGPLARNLEIILQAARRGRELVQQIIAFSRQEQQTAEAIDMVTVVKEAVRLLRSSIPKNIQIRESISIPSALVRADATKVHQILMNLGANAVHAMSEGGGSLDVSLAELEIGSDKVSPSRNLKAGPYLKLTLADTGHGMTRDVLARIFDPFFTTKKPGEGSGMGLAVVHGIVKSCGGSISARSEVGKGTTIEVLLPRLKGKPAGEPAEAKPAATGKGRILFVDDEEIVIHSIQPMLERLGYRVTGRTNSEEALALFRERPSEFDLVITDQIMPGLTGDKLAVKVLAVRPDIPVILATGFSDTIQFKEARALGIRDFILKPFSIGEIAEKVRRALAKG